MKKLTSCSILALLFILTGCSTTIDFHGSTNIFTGPEVIGTTLGFNGQLGVGNSTKFKLASLEQKSIFSSQAVVNTDSGMTKDNNFNSHLGLGLGERFELYYRIMGDSPDPFGVKWQIVGDGVNKKSRGLKFLVFAGIAPKYSDKGTLVASNGSGTTRTYSADLEVSMSEFGASVGFRQGPLLMFYTTPFYRQYGAEAHLTSTSNPNLLIDKNAIVRGIAVGTMINFTPKTVINIESGYAHSQYSSSSQKDDYSLGASLGINLF
ncbi:MAG: hypothetical protein WC635_06210 [Bacteriovorax sp.]|jgi:hypothetical protein